MQRTSHDLEVQMRRTYISGLDLARVGALLAENRARKNQKLSLLDKNVFSILLTGIINENGSIYVQNCMCIEFPCVYP